MDKKYPYHFHHDQWVVWIYAWNLWAVKMGSNLTYLGCEVLKYRSGPKMPRTELEMCSPEQNWTENNVIGLKWVKQKMVRICNWPLAHK